MGLAMLFYPRRDRFLDLFSSSYTSVFTVLVLHGTTVLDEFLGVVGERASDLYNTFVTHCLLLWVAIPTLSPAGTFRVSVLVVLCARV